MSRERREKRREEKGVRSGERREGQTKSKNKLRGWRRMVIIRDEDEEASYLCTHAATTRTTQRMTQRTTQRTRTQCVTCRGHVKV